MNDVFKKTVNYKLFTKLSAIDSSGFVLKTQYSTDKSGLEKKVDEADMKIPDTNKIVNKNNIMLRSQRLKPKYLLLLS